MKTLARTADQQNIRGRLASLRPDAQRRWGTMDVVQMLCHLADSYELALGRRQAEPIKLPMPRMMKQIALWSPLPWPHSLQTVPEVDAMRAGAQHDSFDRERARLLSTFETFVVAPDLAGRPHPMFGPLDAKDWHRWGYLHPDHHLRQFGA